MNQYSKNNLENRLIYNNIWYNLLQNRITANEIDLFIEDVLTIEDVLIYPVLTKDLAYNDIDINPKLIIVNITNNGKHPKDIYPLLQNIFLSYKIKYDITYDIHKQRYLILRL